MVARGAALSVDREVVVHALSAVLAPSPVHELGRGARREVGKGVARVSLGLPEVQKA